MVPENIFLSSQSIISFNNPLKKEDILYLKTQIGYFVLKFVETVFVVMKENVSRQVMYFWGFLFVKGRARGFHVFHLNKVEFQTVTLLEK